MLQSSGEALIREAVAAAMKQDARAESSHPALVDRLAERKIEMTAVRSVMQQLQRTESNRPFLTGAAGDAGQSVGLKSVERTQQLASLPASFFTAARKVRQAKARLAAKVGCRLFARTCTRPCSAAGAGIGLVSRG